METTEKILKLAAENRQQAFRVIEQSNVVVLLALSACTGTRGTIGSQRVCTNDYLLGVISLSELVSPCGK